MENERIRFETSLFPTLPSGLRVMGLSEVLAEEWLSDTIAVGIYGPGRICIYKQQRSINLDYSSLPVLSVYSSIASRYLCLCSLPDTKDTLGGFLQLTSCYSCRKVALLCASRLDSEGELDSLRLIAIVDLVPVPRPGFSRGAAMRLFSESPFFYSTDRAVFEGKTAKYSFVEVTVNSWEAYVAVCTAYSDTIAFLNRVLRRYFVFHLQCFTANPLQ